MLLKHDGVPVRAGNELFCVNICNPLLYPFGWGLLAQKVESTVATQPLAEIAPIATSRDRRDDPQTLIQLSTSITK
ncbi:MAG: hypothetical protein C4B59_15870 [Candidatus Methanogaster sp.]|uniref:Uncharacterized protein n=1 Tax=Candidatus Methanogaster sp. TaxID=3386292 RepID=A0AC61KYK4_9EURY|nr:MAG: hypothetical protein C4B59_15870 [ANME-2 cluster archaeon]